MRHQDHLQPKVKGIQRDCELCGRSFLAYHPTARFCSIPCRNKASNINREASFTCTVCSSVYTLRGSAQQRRSRLSIPHTLCKKCLTSGERSPTWKGGWRYYDQGRFGSDENGFSWKIQRSLAWERDNLTCQNCGFSKDKWKPCVHHIVPWRISKSHALGNLLCLCRKCHGILEAKILEFGYRREEATPRFAICRCGKPCKLDMCFRCLRTKQAEENKYIKQQKSIRVKQPKEISEAKQKCVERIALKESHLPQILSMHDQGFSLAEIAKSLPFEVHRQTIYYWCKFKTVTGYKHLCATPTRSIQAAPIIVAQLVEQSPDKA